MHAYKASRSKQYRRTAPLTALGVLNFVCNNFGVY